MPKPKKTAKKKEPEGEVLFATINDPEGLLAGDLCSLLLRRCHATVEKRAVAGREDAFEVVALKLDDYYRSWYLEDALKEFEREVSRWQFPEVIPLGFDPEAETADDEAAIVRRLWRDPFARSLWTGLRWRRLASQYFNASVEACVDYCRELQRKNQFTRQALNRYFWRMKCFGSAELTGVVVARLWPYLTGEKVFRYEIEERK